MPSTSLLHEYTNIHKSHHGLWWSMNSDLFRAYPCIKFLNVEMVFPSMVWQGLAIRLLRSLEPSRRIRIWCKNTSPRVEELRNKGYEGIRNRGSSRKGVKPTSYVLLLQLPRPRLCVSVGHVHTYWIYKLAAHFLCCKVLKRQDIGDFQKCLQSICCAIWPSVGL